MLLIQSILVFLQQMDLLLVEVILLLDLEHHLQLVILGDQLVHHLTLVQILMDHVQEQLVQLEIFVMVLALLNPHALQVLDFTVLQLEQQPIISSTLQLSLHHQIVVEDFKMVVVAQQMEIFQHVVQ